MQAKDVFDELRTILVARLKFDPRRAAEVAQTTPLPKGVEGSIGLDSLDFIELSIAIEERFGVVLDESEELSAHFTSFDTLSRFIAGRLGASPPARPPPWSSAASSATATRKRPLPPCSSTSSTRAGCATRCWSRSRGPWRPIVTAGGSSA